MAGTRQNSISADDLLQLQLVSDAQIHPAGGTVAYVVAANVSEPHKTRIPARIWLVPTDGGAPRPITTEETRAAQPRWSPDGARLAFLGSRTIDGKDQAFVLDSGWGEARQLTDCPEGVSGIAWTPDGMALTLLVADPNLETDDDRESGRDWTVYEARHRFARLQRCDIITGELSHIPGIDTQVWEFAWSPDGKEIAALISDEPYNWSWYRARLVRLDVASGDVTELYAPKKQMTFPTWSLDGQQIAVISCVWSDQGMTGGDVVLLDRNGGSWRNLTEGHPRSYLSATWEPDGERLLCAAIEDGEATLGYLSLDGAFDSFWRERASILRYAGVPVSRSENGMLAVVRGDPTQPAEVYTLDPNANVSTQLTHTNPYIADRELASIETLRWRSFDGLEMQGLLARPRDSTPGQPLPTIVLVHGGPTGLWSYDFPGVRSMGWVQLLAAAGYAVFLPNPRGSMGFGTAFAEANNGDMGGSDWQDVMCGTDWCIAQGISDPERLGLGGWSYGGYLTAWGVTQTDRFKASVAGASITNWVSFHGVSTIPDFDAVFYDTDPYEWDGRYGQFSPIAHIRSAKTPTLLLHGERDPICPVGQAHEMFRALKELGVETELVVYPREGHGMRERAHARDVLERAVRWFVERV